ncbi:MAG: zinc-dependent metalloprotease [Brevundimonas sp.]|uniref:zinc-dependent metalloprotease n=1 Tax=Brevundimonas sp. TaxID=1871086 RepID=UPI002732B115|nr:zinc-dependent metalloprotease [Brevundimonas sp.]MDP3403534.1 zinc-dependent metalloprotease [Brevundimonas sp.]
MVFGFGRTATAIALVLALGGYGGTAAARTDPVSWSESVSGLTRQDGLLTLFPDADKGRVLLQLPPAASDGTLARVIHHTALRTGVGSAVTGLDRAQIGPTNILAFRRIGGRVLAEFENPRYRATAGSAEEQAAARDAFVGSTVWSGEIVSTAADGSVLVDISSFITRDAHGIVQGLARAGQGTLRPVSDLTMVDASAARSFPDNVELEARLTFAVDNPGRVLNQIAPDARLATFTVRHSFIRLPDTGFVPRPYDPRTGALSTLITDFSAPLDAPVVSRVANRFRLVKTDPAAARSTVVEPIVFYVDRAAPEPIRSALVEGALWWADAFERAGYIDAFRVEVLPEGVDALDARYNVINWVNRATRSWSYGQSVVDPRTGEIVKGSVLLGSLRIRQDMLIFEGLVGADQTGTGGPNDPQAVALARIRQLSAHEVGHAIGLLHNFAASTQGRASVMDYPVPQIAVNGDRLDFAEAYAVGMGGWDRFAIDWLYADVQPAELERRAAAAAGAGTWRFVSDPDARTGGDAQAWGSLWDNGSDPVAELEHLMQVRRIALGRFGLGSLPEGSAVNDLRRRLVPIYLFHRYQIDAVAKLVGGLDYGYPVLGDGREAAAPVPAATQRAALQGLLATLTPAELDLPDPLLALLAAQQSGDSDPQHDIEVFASRQGRAFDAGSAAEAAADITLAALFAPQRVERLTDAVRRDPSALGLVETVDTVTAAVFAPVSGRLGEPARRVQARTALTLAALLQSDDLSATSVAVIDDRLQSLAARLAVSRAADPVQRAHDRWLGGLLQDRGRLDQVLAANQVETPTPPGSPIGAEACWHC